MKYAALALLPLLVACATPRAQCNSAAIQQRDIIGALMIETEQNIGRGYAIQTDLRAEPRVEFCYARRSNGSFGMILCNQLEPVEVDRPVTIDIATEKAKLTALREKYAELSQEADIALAQCAARYPE